MEVQAQAGERLKCNLIQGKDASVHQRHPSAGLLDALGETLHQGKTLHQVIHQGKTLHQPSLEQRKMHHVQQLH